ncbi:hypothetical protein DO72_3742 [Burkholderia pseudomallei]|nr:hypothetical protein DO72_3742 [Burkholderia pseudomallei]
MMGPYHNQTGVGVPKYQVHAYTQCGHNRVAVVAVTARSAESARGKARSELSRRGRCAESLTLISVQVSAPSSAIARMT